MSLIKRLKSVLGLNGSPRDAEDGPVAVTVEHDPEPTEEPEEVFEPDPEPEPESTDASEETAEEESDSWTHEGPVTEISGIGPSYSERLADANIETVGDLAAADSESLHDETGLSEKRLGGWIDAAQDLASGE